MKKYKYILTFIILTLTVPNIVLGQTTDLNQKAACNNKRNGDACTYQEVSGARGQTSNTSKQGFCDRSNGGGDANSNPLTCKSGNDANGWEVCTISGDACKTGSQLGVCGTRGPRGIPCDTTKKPPGNPGGRSSAGSSPGGANTGSGNTGGGETSPGGANTGSAGGNTTPTDASAAQTVGFTNPIRFNTIPELIAGVINALLGILGAITVAILVMSGFKYMTSSNPGEVGQALDGIKNAVVGLMIIMGAFLITQYVISALAV